MENYDYKNQAWTKNGRYIACNHPENMNCNCYGKLHAGELSHIINPSKQALEATGLRVESAEELLVRLTNEQ